MTLGELKEQTKGLSDDLVLEFYSEKYNDSTQPTRLEFDTEGYIEFIIDDDRWCLEQNPALDKIRAEIVDLGQRTMNDNRASGIWAC